MAYLQNSIGDFDFITLIGAIDRPGNICVSSSFPGTPGTKFKLLGNKGKPFTLLSHCDFNSLLLAEMQVIQYKQLIEQEPVPIVQDGVPTINFLVKVRDVVEVDRYTVTTAIGNKKSALAKAMLVCQWVLEAVPLSSL